MLHLDSCLRLPDEGKMLWLRPSLKYSHINTFNELICLKMNSRYIFLNRVSSYFT